MDEKDYVLFEVAKKLEEKGFKPRGVYLWDRGMLLPTLYEAQKWIREKKGIHITLDFCKSGWYCILYKFPEGEFILQTDEYKSSYEEALNDGILETLKLI